MLARNLQVGYRLHYDGSWQAKICEISKTPEQVTIRLRTKKGFEVLTKEPKEQVEARR